MRLAVHATAMQQGAHLSLTCDLDCTYVAQLYRLPGKLLVSKRGRAVGGQASRLAFTVPKATARYRLRVSAVAALNPGAATTLLRAVRPG
jgi:hypothetical protein